MDDPADTLLGIGVDADDYAETAAGDTPNVSRTHQSRADFEAQKAGYSAKIDDGNNHLKLLHAVPALQDHSSETAVNGDASKVRLSKQHVKLLGYAVGELYYDRQYQKVIELCERVQAAIEVDGKTAESLDRWASRCKQRMHETENAR